MITFVIYLYVQCVILEFLPAHLFIEMFKLFMIDKTLFTLFNNNQINGTKFHFSYRHIVYNNRKPILCFVHSLYFSFGKPITPQDFSTLKIQILMCHTICFRVLENSLLRCDTSHTVGFEKSEIAKLY